MTTPRVTPTHRAPTAHPARLTSAPYGREVGHAPDPTPHGSLLGTRWATLPSGHGRKARRLPTV